MPASLSLLPIATWVVFVILNRMSAFSIGLHMSLVTTLLLFFATSPTRKIRFCMLSFTFFYLFYGYINLARDIAILNKGLIYYGYAGVVIMGLRRYRPSYVKYGICVFLLAVALIFEFIRTMPDISQLAKMRIDPWLRDSSAREMIYYPYGMVAPLPLVRPPHLGPDASGQANRYPELARDEVNFLGSRAFLCDTTYYDYRASNCSEGIKSYPYAIWTTFFLTPDFLSLFRSEPKFERASQAVLGSFVQGLSRRPEDSREGLFEKPLCESAGYLHLKSVSGDEMVFEAASQEARTLTLPVFDQFGTRVSVESSGKEMPKASIDGLFEVPLEAKSLSVIKFTPSRRWLISVGLFWLPALLCGIYGLALGLMKVSRGLMRRRGASS